MSEVRRGAAIRTRPAISTNHEIKDMTETIKRESRRETIYSYESELGDLLRSCQTLDDLEVWVAKVISLVPEPYRDTACVEIESEYDDRNITVDLSYERPETDEEMRGRVRQMATAVEAAKMMRYKAFVEARNIYLAMKDEYENKSGQ